MSTDNREDILLRPEPTFAPYSVYVDVSPTTTVLIDVDGYDNSKKELVSDTFRVWDLWGDFHNLATAKEVIKDIKETYWVEPKIYDNNLESFISDHPVFGK